jgi:hypothetical protein
VVAKERCDLEGTQCVYDVGVKDATLYLQNVINIVIFLIAIVRAPPTAWRSAPWLSYGRPPYCRSATSGCSPSSRSSMVRSCLAHAPLCD